MKRLFVAAMLMAASSYPLAAVSQTANPPPPTDLELEQARGKLLEGQIGYLAALARRAEAELNEYRAAGHRNLVDPKATAAWWAAYAADKDAPK